jgi:hypothetical protein
MGTRKDWNKLDSHCKNASISTAIKPKNIKAEIDLTIKVDATIKALSRNDLIEKYTKLESLLFKNDGSLKICRCERTQSLRLGEFREYQTELLNRNNKR